MNINTTAVLIKSFKYREADKLYTFFAKDLGKISAVGKSVLKTKSKVGPSLEFLNTLLVSIYKKNGFGIIKEVKIVQAVPTEKKERNFNFIHYVCDFLNKTLEEDNPANDIYIFLEKFIKFFLKTNESDVFYYCVFTTQILSVLGFMININHCSNCQEKDLSNLVYVTPAFDGFLCNKCTSNGIRISPNAIKFLKVLQNGNYQIISKLSVPTECLNEVKSILISSVHSHLQINLKSQGFIN